MNLSLKSCLRIALSVFLLYLAIHYWPTVSGLLARLEKKGFIEFRPDEHDKRCKRIYILEKGHQLHELIHVALNNNEATLVQDFTDEEKAQFHALLMRAIQNMGETPCKRKKEETQK